jgi:hypothetical protein
MITSHPPFYHTATELEFGTFLGAGGFCIVSELSGINTGEKEAARDTIELDDEGKVIQDRDFIASHLYRDNCARYAIKKLAPTLFRKPAGTFLSGVVDLAMEVKYLAVIQVRDFIYICIFACR